MNIAGTIEYLSAGLSPVTDEHLTEARLAVSDMAEIPYNRLNKYKASTFPAALMPRLEELVSRRKSGEPLQYILGKWEFMGLPFYTRHCALIPRQDTETLCEEALSIGGKTLLDLCCGTGCIGVSLAKLGGFEVAFGDISPDCLALARENAALNGVAGSFVLTDMFGNISGSYDMICVNPPYIPTSELASLQAEVKREPRLALDGGADGLDFYRRISRDYAAHLSPGGTLLMEVGAGQAEDVAEMFPKAEIIKDICGIKRVVAVRG
ncbi:MAG: peptide chain release factor N(5)-glutamine methyltransferase [Clostridium sp.]|nr:peptide chain release factor N(5)-glutamine methyltransferase [Clostridium sp.]